MAKRMIKKILYGALSGLTDETYLKVVYFLKCHKRLDLNNPKSFNEKLQWLKIYDRKSEYTQMVDKYAVKEYVKGILGEDVIIPTYGVWNSFDEIDFDKLPQSFVLKCTHDSGGIVLVKNKAELDFIYAKRVLESALKRDFYRLTREWPYKNVKPKIIAEAYMGDNLQDYKLFCFNGETKMVLVCTDRYEQQGMSEDFFDSQWNHLPVKRPKHPNASQTIKKPATLSNMIEHASVIGRNIPFARVDFYEIEGKAYFGEITFYPASGFEKFQPEKWDRKIGEWIDI